MNLLKHLLIELRSSTTILASAFLTLFSPVAVAIEIEQAEKIASRFENTNGNSIELKFRFSVPVKDGDEFSVVIGDAVAMSARVTDKLVLSGILARFRVNENEPVLATHYRAGVPIVQSRIIPKVSKSFELKPAEKSSLAILTTSNIETLKRYGMQGGGCLVLFNNLANDDPSTTLRLTIRTNRGAVNFEVGPRVSANPTFGLTPDVEEIKSCEGAQL